jgi:hypothetical protein
MTNEEADSFDYEDEDTGLEAIAPPADLESSPFSREDLINAQELRTAKYIKVALQEFRELDCSMELKQAYGRWVSSYFDTQHLLANNSPRKSGIFSERNMLDGVILSADLELEKCAISCCHFDTLQPWCGSI